MDNNKEIQNGQEATQQAGATQQVEATQQATATQQQQASYAVRPQRHHHRRLEYSDRSNMLGVRNALNIAFMLFAIIGVVLFYQLEDNRTVAYVLLIIGVILKIAEVCIRMFKK